MAIAVEMPVFEARMVTLATTKGPVEVRAFCYKGLCYHERLYHDTSFIPYREWRVSGVKQGLSIPLDCVSKEQAEIFLLRIVNLVDWQKLTNATLDTLLIRKIENIYRGVLKGMPAPAGSVTV